MGATILVTGASGFIGGAVASALVERGYDVRATYRRADPPEALKKLAENGAELIRFDLESSNPYDPLVAECDYVVHTAARVVDYGKLDPFISANIDVTRRLVESANAAGCRRFVFLSSISVHGFGKHLDSTESGPYYPLTSHYQRTKIEAENIVRSCHADSFETVIVRPGLVYGPGDTTTLVPFFELLEKRSLPRIAGFETMNCPVFISDLVDGIILAIETSEASGGVFNLTSGEKVSLWEAVTVVASLIGAPAPRLRLPQWIARAGAAIYEAASRITGYRFRPPLTRYLAAQLNNNFHFSPERARAVLGFDPKVNWQEGIRVSVDAYFDRKRSRES
jgi:2-alkyl-3-oxoalkanoate reductase